MSKRDIADTIIKGGKQTIGISNSLHKELESLSSYDLSVVFSMVEDAGLHIDQDIMSTEYEVY